MKPQSEGLGVSLATHKLMKCRRLEQAGLSARFFYKNRVDLFFR